MKLYQPSNSHGALWNDTNYNWNICYDEIFGETYGAEPFIFRDDFDGGTLDNNWEVIRNDPNGYSLENGKLNIDLLGKNDGSKVELKLKQEMYGNFEVEMSFSDYWTSAINGDINLKIAFEDGFWVMIRRTRDCDLPSTDDNHIPPATSANECNTEYLEISYPGGVGPADQAWFERNDDSSGVFKIKRQGNEIIFYYNNVEKHRKTFDSLAEVATPYILAQTLYEGDDFKVKVDNFMASSFKRPSSLNQHNCTGNNKIVGLFENTNSHAEIPSLNNYRVDVCYGDLVCQRRDKKCNDDEKMVVALFDDTNSHLTDPNYVPEGMVSWWRFDDSTANDWLGRNNGEFKGGAHTTEDPDKIIIGKALELDGADDYVEIPDDDSLDLTNEITMEAWVKPGQQSDSTCTGGGIILNKEYSYEIAITKDNSVEWALAGPTGNPPSQWQWYNTWVTISQNVWSHIVVTYSPPIAKTYINGELVDTFDVTNHPYHYSTDLIPSDLKLDIGARTTPLDHPHCPGVNSFFNGEIDEVAIYNRALTQEEIQHRYNMGMYEKKICCKSGGAVPPTPLPPAPLDVTITSPSCGSNFTLNSTGQAEVAIRIRVEDNSNNVTGRVYFGDGTSLSLSRGINSFNHVYNISGNIKIIAQVTNADGKTKIHSSNIMIVDPTRDAKYVAACIDEPRDYTHLTSSHVRFNATSTRAIIVSNGEQTVLNYDNESLKYTWIFSDGTIFSALGNSTSIKPYDFTMIFHPAPGEYDWATLTVEVL